MPHVQFQTTLSSSSRGLVWPAALTTLRLTVPALRNPQSLALVVSWFLTAVTSKYVTFLTCDQSCCRAIGTGIAACVAFFDSASTPL